MHINDLFRATTPVLPKRGVHLDLKGVPPTAERLLSLLDLFAGARYNVVLVEWEDTFPWTVDPRFRGPTAYTPDEIKAFCEKAARLDLDLIPLVQCLGHMETPLSVKGYEHLREIPDFEAGLNPLAPGARDLIQNMVDDVLTLMPDVKHFHLGGDEARSFGRNPETAAYIEANGKGALYLHHVEPILDNLGARGIRPILWHDMMIDWDGAALEALSRKCDLMPWVYNADPRDAGEHCNTAILNRFLAHGLTLWGAGAYKGAEGHNVDLPDIPLHERNAQAWAETGAEFGLVGVIATAWSRYAVDTVQCNPIDACLDSLLHVAVILHDGTPAEGGVDACIAALASVGERERFEVCRSIMARLTRLRREGWEKVQHAREVMVLAQSDPRRTSAANPKLGLHALVRLEKLVEMGDALSSDAHTCFKGLLPELCLEEYLNTRLVPFRHELASLKEDLRLVAVSA